jgi:hypothetical protein
MATEPTPKELKQALTVYAAELAALRGTLAQVAHAAGISPKDIPGHPVNEKSACIKAGLAEPKGWKTLGKLVAKTIAEQRAELTAMHKAEQEKLAGLFQLADLGDLGEDPSAVNLADFYAEAKKS